MNMHADRLFPLSKWNVSVVCRDAHGAGLLGESGEGEG